MTRTLAKIELWLPAALLVMDLGWLEVRLKTWHVSSAVSLDTLLTRVHRVNTSPYSSPCPRAEAEVVVVVDLTSPV